MKTIPAEFLKALSNVEFLHFTNNVLECFLMSSLKTLQFSKGINLANNLIKTVDNIGHCGRQGLDLSDNHLVCDDRYVRFQSNLSYHSIQDLTYLHIVCYYTNYIKYNKLL